MWSDARTVANCDSIRDRPPQLCIGRSLDEEDHCDCENGDSSEGSQTLRLRCASLAPVIVVKVTGPQHVNIQQYTYPQEL